MLPSTFLDKDCWTFCQTRPLRSTTALKQSKYSHAPNIFKDYSNNVLGKIKFLIIKIMDKIHFFFKLSKLRTCVRWEGIPLNERFCSIAKQNVSR